MRCRVLRLAFLSPKLTEAILAGTLKPGVGARTLFENGAIDALWSRQQQALLPG